MPSSTVTSPVTAALPGALTETDQVTATGASTRDGSGVWERIAVVVPALLT